MQMFYILKSFQDLYQFLKILSDFFANHKRIFGVICPVNSLLQFSQVTQTYFDCIGQCCDNVVECEFKNCFEI